MEYGNRLHNLRKENTKLKKEIVTLKDLLEKATGGNSTYGERLKKSCLMEQNDESENGL